MHFKAKSEKRRRKVRRDESGSYHSLMITVRRLVKYIQLCSREERKESTSTALVEILSNIRGYECRHFKFDFKSMLLLMHYFQALRDRNR